MPDSQHPAFGLLLRDTLGIRPTFGIFLAMAQEGGVASIDDGPPSFGTGKSVDVPESKAAGD